MCITWRDERKQTKAQLTINGCRIPINANHRAKNRVREAKERSDEAIKLREQLERRERIDYEETIIDSRDLDIDNSRKLHNEKGEYIR